MRRGDLTQHLFSRLTRMVYVLAMAFVFYSHNAHAQEYPAGSLGYLYADCKTALEKSESFEALHRSWCGAFVEGYVVGVLSANGMELKNTAQKDACWGERQAEYDRINDRLCPNLPAFDQNTTDPGYMLRSVIHVAVRWIGYLDSRAGDQDPLMAPLSAAVNDMLRPGAFCEDLAVHKAVAVPAPRINPALSKLNSLDVLAFQNHMKSANKYEQCKADLAFAAGDADLFQRTRCYSEIAGFMAGVQSTLHLQEGRRVVENPACGKEIDRLYSTLDVRKSMCLSADTKPMRIAEIFTQNYDLLKTPQSLYNPFFNPSDIESVGYNVIYRGFLCVDQGR